MIQALAHRAGARDIQRLRSQRGRADLRRSHGDRLQRMGRSRHQAEPPRLGEGVEQARVDQRRRLHCLREDRRVLRTLEGSEAQVQPRRLELLHAAVEALREPPHLGELELHDAHALGDLGAHVRDDAVDALRELDAQLGVELAHARGQRDVGLAAHQRRGRRTLRGLLARAIGAGALADVMGRLDPAVGHPPLGALGLLGGILGAAAEVGECRAALAALLGQVLAELREGALAGRHFAAQRGLHAVEARGKAVKQPALDVLHLLREVCHEALDLRAGAEGVVAAGIPL
mmetsp:Transcript_75892/g.195554  ORF Transcript_75892/g.195554 Transcript_75892/m.195554 type:complete len:289 (-) Transcript_75892:1163-2029(-)